MAYSSLQGTASGSGEDLVASYARARKVPIGVGIAVCPQSSLRAVCGIPSDVRTSIVAPELLQPGVGWGGEGDGASLGIDFGRLFSGVKNIVGPAIGTGVQAFKDRVTGALLNTPEVRSAAASAAGSAASSLFQKSAPLIVAGLVGLLFLQRRRRR